MNRKEIKAQHQRLAEREPFSSKEQERYDKKDQSMIRNIQILNGIDKDKALQVFQRYKSTGKKEFQRLTKATRKKIKAGYPKQADKPNINGTVKQHKKPTIKEPKAGKKQASKRTVATEKHEKTKRSSYLKDSSKKSNKNYTRIEKASKKYIDASKPELEHGVNSKWSQDYREKMGLSRKYEGRVIK